METIVFSLTIWPTESKFDDISGFGFLGFWLRSFWLLEVWLFG
jgi:hypothetical protein